jgi:hypothetical protein
MRGLWGGAAVGGGGGAMPRGPWFRCPWVSGAGALFRGQLLMGSRGGTYMDRNWCVGVTKGTNTSRPTTISRPGKVAWRAWPTITLRSQWRLQVIAILSCLCSPCHHGSVSHPESIGRWGEGGGLPLRLPPLINGPVDSGIASSGTNLQAGFWGAALASGVRGCSGAVPCSAPPSPPPTVVFRGLCVFLLWGYLLCIDTRVWHILRHNISTLGTMAQYINSWNYGTVCPLLSLLILSIGSAALYVNYRVTRDCHMGSIASWPPCRW